MGFFRGETMREADARMTPKRQGNLAAWLPALVASSFPRRSDPAAGAPPMAPVVGEIERISVDDPSDVWPGGRIVVRGDNVVIPRILSFHPFGPADVLAWPPADPAPIGIAPVEPPSLVCFAGAGGPLAVDDIAETSPGVPVPIGMLANDVSVFRPVGPGSRAPVAVNDIAAIAKNAMVAIPVPANDAGIADPGTLKIVSGPLHGAAVHDWVAGGYLGYHAL